MKYSWITAFVIAALALAAGCASYLCLREPPTPTENRTADALLWLRREFPLPADKMARIEALHAAYQKVCARHCEAIQETRTELRRLHATSAAPADIAAADARLKQVDAECLAGTEAHIREVAALIGGAEGQRYLALVLPRVAGFDHQAPATLDMENPSAHPHDHHAGN